MAAPALGRRGGWREETSGAGCGDRHSLCTRHRAAIHANAACERPGRPSDACSRAGRAGKMWAPMTSPCRQPGPPIAWFSVTSASPHPQFILTRLAGPVPGIAVLSIHPATLPAAAAPRINLVQHRAAECRRQSMSAPRGCAWTAGSRRGDASARSQPCMGANTYAGSRSAAPPVLPQRPPVPGDRPPPAAAHRPALRTLCRRPKELRQLRAELGVLSSADGSALFEMGNTRVLAAVFGPKPVEQRSQEDERRAIVKCEYAMASFSTGAHEREERPDGKSLQWQRGARRQQGRVACCRRSRRCADVGVGVGVGTRAAAIWRWLVHRAPPNGRLVRTPAPSPPHPRLSLRSRRAAAARQGRPAGHRDRHGHS